MRLPALWLAVAFSIGITTGSVFALVASFSLGGLALTLERAAVPSNLVTRLLAAGRLDGRVRFHQSWTSRKPDPFQRTVLRECCS